MNKSFDPDVLKIPIRDHVHPGPIVVRPPITHSHKYLLDGEWTEDLHHHNAIVIDNQDGLMQVYV